MVNVYVFPKGLVLQGRKSPRYVWMESIYKDSPDALVSMIGLQGEEGHITLLGNEELHRRTKWGTICHWCEKKYYLGNMLIIIDEDGIKSVMCPKCYEEIVDKEAAGTVYPSRFNGPTIQCGA